MCVRLYVSIGQSCFEKVLDPVSLRITVVIKITYIVTKYCKILRCVKKKKVFKIIKIFKINNCLNSETFSHSPIEGCSISVVLQ